MNIIIIMMMMIITTTTTTGIYSKTNMEMGRTYIVNERQQIDQTLNRVTTPKREKIQRTTKQKMAG